MVKEVSCIHAGFTDCEFLIRSENEDEIFEFVKAHAKRSHDLDVDRDHVGKLMKDV